ncbi:MAG: helix-turn-helix domain-containing protein [Flavobacteriales bacterium]|nr:helix-turn-helix domain-containing protein [Flavobacteriales bacterium]
MEIIVFEKEAYYKMLAEIKHTVRQGIRDANTELTKSMKQGSNGELWVSGKEAQKILDVKQDKLRMLRNNNEVKSSQHGRKIRYYKPSLYEFLERNTTV